MDNIYVFHYLIQNQLSKKKGKVVAIFVDPDGTITLPVVISGWVHQHDFLIMLSLRSSMLIGVDLWTKIKITFRASPPDPTTRVSIYGATVQDLANRMPEEKRRLQFLAYELRKFEGIQGLIDRMQHHIRLKTDQPNNNIVRGILSCRLLSIRRWKRWSARV